MKSFEKFQYDTSPYEIDEEVEELAEDLVGMVKKGITATGNVLDKFSENLKDFRKAIAEKNGDKLIKFFESTKNVRKEIVKAKQEVNLPDFGRKKN